MQYSDACVQYVGALERPHLRIGPTYIGPNTLCDVCTTILTDLLNNTRCTFESAYACLQSIHPLTHSSTLPHLSLSTLSSSVSSLRARVCIQDIRSLTHSFTHPFTITSSLLPTTLFLCVSFSLTTRDAIKSTAAGCHSGHESRSQGESAAADSLLLKLLIVYFRFTLGISRLSGSVMHTTAFQ